MAVSHTSFVVALPNSISVQHKLDGPVCVCNQLNKTNGTEVLINV